MRVYDCDIRAVVCILDPKCHRRGCRPRYYNKHNADVSRHLNELPTLNYNEYLYTHTRLLRIARV